MTITNFHFILGDVMKKYIVLLTLVLSVSIFCQTKSDWAGRQYGNGAIVSTETDTLSRVLNFASGNNLSSVFKNWFSYSVLADDTIQVSANASFSTGTVVVILPDVPFTSQKINLDFTKDLYVKRWGTVGTVNYYIAVEGN